MAIFRPYDDGRGIFLAADYWSPNNPDLVVPVLLDVPERKGSKELRGHFSRLVDLNSCPATAPENEKEMTDRASNKKEKSTPLAQRGNSSQATAS